MIGFFDQFTQEPGGYLTRHNEDDFPWEETGRAVWYLLIVVERGELHTYGFTSSHIQKANLLKALECVKPEEPGVKLLGVWHGNWYTSLFELDIEIAKQKLSEVLS